MATKSTGTMKKKTTAELLREKKISAYLEQISQGEEMINLLSGERASLLAESIVGLPVFHRQFGNGLVAGQDAITICVQFVDGIRRFPIPNAFLDGFLKTEDAAMARRLGRYQEIGLQILEVKRDIADADHAIQLLKK